MVLRTFDDVRQQVKGAAYRTVVLVGAEDEHSQEAIFKVVEDGLVQAVFVGDRDGIHAVAQKLGKTIPEDRIYDAATPQEAAERGVQLIHEGVADFLMKGKLETADLLKPVINKETGLSKGGVMSHMSFNQVPTYHKLLVTTDGGMMTYPTLPQKRCIIENAVEALHALGCEKPKVCVLAAVEKVNPKMPETVEAAALKDMQIMGEIGGCIVEGPISLDLALVKERSVEKGYESPCAGDADVLLVPNVHTGNILGKTLVEMANTKMAGLVMGAKCPIVLTSRGSSVEEKYNALILACAVCRQEGQ